MDNVNLTDNFLIAMPAMQDPYFAHSLVYICEHNENGALGIIVNRPIDMNLAGLFEKIDLPLKDTSLADLPVYFGGPVQLDRGFVLHRPVGHWQSTLAVNGSVGLTSSRDILVAVGSEGQPAELIVTLGYAGWGAGQLEDELAQNAWLTVPAPDNILFDLPPEERLPAAMQKLGISFTQLSDVAGHAWMGTVLAFDFGEKRIGVATGETLLGQAHPLTVIRAESNDDRFDAIAKLVAEWQPERFVVGLPTHMDGTPHAMTTRCQRFAERLERRFQRPVSLADERLTSLDAEVRLREAGRSAKAAKPVLDAVAAQLILQTWFDTHHHASHDTPA